MKKIETASMAFPLSYISLFIILLATTAYSQSNVSTFSYTNQGEFGPYITENNADYRTIPIAKSPFQLAFYNTTPDQFYLALRMGTSRSESIFRWVWQANPYHPVHDNAVFALRSDGNLVLSQPDGQIVWSTNTSNKGVIGLRILPSGNIVLYDRNNNYVWQSFDYPVDTLLVGQSLHVNQRLVSKNGEYSFVFNSTELAFYMKNNIKYGLLYEIDNITSIKFVSEPTTDDAYAYELSLKLGEDGGSITLAFVKYNTTLSFLRIEDDGNFVAYTFYAPVDYMAWEMTFSFFSDAIGRIDGCELPSKCGRFGVCKDEMCVACPTKNGLVGWSEQCSTPDVGICRGSKAGEGVKYYKVEGVDNFLSRYGERLKGLTVGDCMKKCSLNCKCLGFLYRELEKACWLAPVIGTLRSVANSTHVAYIKYA